MEPLEMSYKKRLEILKMLPVAYDGEINDLVFLHKAVDGCTDINIHEYVRLVSHGRARR